MGLESRAEEHPDRLSGGQQQQRVPIIQALANKPRLLLIDELTSVLDAELVGEVLATIRDRKSQGTHGHSHT